MDLILISEEKLKIILSEDDLKKLNIDIDSLDYSNVSTKRVFWEILDRAKETAGFDADKCKLYVQVFPSQDGGCEMFVTKFSNAENKTMQQQSKKYRITKRSSQDKCGRLISAQFEDICKLCRRISDDNMRFDTSLYYDDSGVYILTVKQISRIPSYISSNSQFLTNIPEYLCEYGSVHSLNDKSISYLNEHCRKIADGNAIELLTFI